MTRNEQALVTMTGPTIVEFYNAYCADAGAAPVRKFSDKETAVRRTARVLDEAGMEFDEFCQLRRNHKELPTVDHAEEAREMIEAADAENAAAEEADATAEEVVKGKRQRLVGKRLEFIGPNPFRPGSKSHVAVEQLLANPGATYEELKAMGVEMPIISYANRLGLIRVR